MPATSSKRPLIGFMIKSALLLVSLVGAVLFATPATAASCHEQSDVHSLQSVNPSANLASVVVVFETASVSSDDAAHDCCKPGCQCPAAMCGAGHGAPLSFGSLLIGMGSDESVSFHPQLYSHLPFIVPFKPPIFA